MEKKTLLRRQHRQNLTKNLLQRQHRQNLLKSLWLLQRKMVIRWTRRRQKFILKSFTRWASYRMMSLAM